MIIGSLKCKICGKEIDPPEIVIGERPEARDKRIIARLMKHLERRAEIEKGIPNAGPHLNAIRSAMETCMHISSNLNGALLTGNFELPEDLEQQRLSLLRQVHEMTRQVRMSDEDLTEVIKTSGVTLADYPEVAAMTALVDLRDRYESLGKYAPAPPAPAAPEEVKQ